MRCSARGFSHFLLLVVMQAEHSCVSKFTLAACSISSAEIVSLQWLVGLAVAMVMIIGPNFPWYGKKFLAIIFGWLPISILACSGSNDISLSLQAQKFSRQDSMGWSVHMQCRSIFSAISSMLRIS